MFLQLLFVPHIPQEPFSCSKGLPGINYPAGIRAGQAPATLGMFLHLFHPFPSFLPGQWAEPTPGGFGIFGSGAAKEGEAGKSSPPTRTGTRSSQKLPPKIPTSSHPSLQSGRVQSFNSLQNPCKKLNSAAQPSCAGKQLQPGGGLILDFPSRSQSRRPLQKKKPIPEDFLHMHIPASPLEMPTWPRFRASALLIFSSSISLAMSCLAW